MFLLFLFRFVRCSIINGINKFGYCGFPHLYIVQILLRVAGDLELTAI